ncbi:hypothetical protein [Streptacidiphilus sp. PAMC 29251]
MTGEEHYHRAEDLLERASHATETPASHAALTARAAAHLHAADIANQRETAGLHPYGGAA